jgi:hypothetical protein
VGEGDGTLYVLPPYVKLSRGCPLFELLSTSKIFVSTKIGDLVGGVCTYLPYVGGNIPPISSLKREHAYFFGYTFLSSIVILGGDGTLVTCYNP